MKNILTYVLAAFCLFLIFNTCNLNKKYANSHSTIDSLTLANQKLDSTINKQGETIYTQQAIVADNQAAMQSLTDSIFDLKKKDKKNREIIAYYRGRTVTGIHDTLEISWVDTARVDNLKKDSAGLVAYIKDSTIQVPHTDSLINDNINFNFTLKRVDNKPTLAINKLEFPDTLDLQFVEHKGGLFKRRSIEVQFKHSNEYVKVLGSNSVFFVPKKKGKWLQKAILVGAGIFLGTKL